MFYTILILLFLIITGIIAYLATLEGNYDIRRSKLIKTDIDAAFNKIRDFRSWADWSPWIVHEPDTQLEFSDNCTEEGGFYTWDGKRVGAGKLTHVKFEQPHGIEQRIEFIRPFKSVCQVAFEFAEKDGQTEVTWTMHGKMPFLFRFMTKKTAEMISKDYDLGLAMLAGQLDPTTEYPVLDFQGEATLEPMYSLCEGFEGEEQEMETAMKAGFPKLMSYIEQNSGQICGSPYTAYHKVNLKTMYFVCDMAIPVGEGINAGEYQLKTLGGGRYYKVGLKGSYDFMELAWYSAMAHARMLKFKVDKNRPSLEIYANDPEKVESSNELQTMLYVPIK